MNTVNNLPVSDTIIFHDFQNSEDVPAGYSFIRASAATYRDKTGKVTFADVNEPRIDYDPETGECLGLLAESAATNFVPGFQEWALNIDTTYQTHTERVNGIDDDGPYTDLLKPMLWEGLYNRVYYRTLGNYVGKKYTFSMEIELTSTTDSATPIILIGVGEHAAYPICSRMLFNLKTGELTHDSGDVPDNTVVKKLSKYKWYVAITSQNAVARSEVDNITTIVYPFNLQSSNVRLRRAQFEEGGFASSYIPTTDTIAMRAAELITYTVHEPISVGTIFCEFQATNYVDNSFNFTCYNKDEQAAVPDTYTRLFSWGTGPNTVICGTTGSATSANQAVYNIAGKKGTFLKGVISWDKTTLAAGLGGVITGYKTDTAVKNIDTIRLCSNPLGTYNATTHIKKFCVYPSKMDIDQIKKIME